MIIKTAVCTRCQNYDNELNECKKGEDIGPDKQSECFWFKSKKPDLSQSLALASEISIGELDY